MKRILGLVTARAGSKRFPGKNLALLAGRPLVGWAHRTLSLLRERHPDQIYLHLSTDSQEIADCWPEADRPRTLRPAYLAQDDTPSIDVVLHELDQLASQGFAFDAVLLLQPTSPLINVDDLERMLADGWPSVIAVDSRLFPVGAYLSGVDCLRTEDEFHVPGYTHEVVVPDERAIDIDYRPDLVLAEAYLRTSREPEDMVIDGRAIGGPGKPYVIAEAGVNHSGDLRIALELVRAAKVAGAEAVKFQAFQPAALCVPGRQRDLLANLALPDDAWPVLADECRRAGITFLATPFDYHSVEILAPLVPAFKIGSGEITDLAFLGAVADHGKPIILSTGMATIDEVEDAVACIEKHANPPLALLHCVSSYPAPSFAMNLCAIHSLRTRFGCPVGLSNHSLDPLIPALALAMGASIIEQHLTIDCNQDGPDHRISSDPRRFAAMVHQLAVAEEALGTGCKEPQYCEEAVMRSSRKSLTTACDLPAGHQLALSDLVLKRPGTGIPPRDLLAVLGRSLSTAIPGDTTLTWQHLQ